MIIDLRTVFFIYLITNALCVIVMMSLWLQNRKRFPGITLWLIDFALQFIAILLVFLRGVAPDFVSVVLANTFVIGGTVALYVGLERFTGKQSGQMHNYLMLGVFMMLHAYFTYGYPNLPLRNVNLSLGLLFICAQASWLMLRRAEPRMRPAAKATGIVLALFCLMSLVRIPVNLAIWRDAAGAHLFQSDFFNAIILITYLALFVGLTFALFILVNRRLSDTLEVELLEREQIQNLMRIRIALFEFSATHSLQELLQKTLDEVAILVNSPIGFYHFLEKDQKTLSLQAWSTRTLNEFCKAEGKGMHYGIDEAGVWVDCVRARKAVVHNNYNSLPHRKGLPEGHAAIIRELVVPIMRGEKIVAILGIGNKPTEYTQKDIEIVAYLADVAWEIAERKDAEEKLKRSEEKYRNILENILEGYFESNLKGDIVFANDSACKMLGYDKETLYKIDYRRFSTPATKKKFQETYAEVFRTGNPSKISDYEIIRGDGVVRINELSVALLRNTAGKATGFRAVARDVTEKKQAEELLAAERRRLANILEGTNVGTWEWNVQTGETVFNERWAEIIGYTLDELAPISIATWKKYTHPDDLKASAELLEKHFKKDLPYYECEGRMRHKNGNWVWVLERGKVVSWTDGGKPLLMYGTHQDITERKQSEEKIKHLATHDSLTDLPTLRLAEDRLTMAMGLASRHKKKAAVIFIDLDGFKKVNDTLGHEAGDLLLKTLSQRFLASIRKTDTIARIGGDEFLLIATELKSVDDAAQIAQKMLKLASQPVTLDGQKVVVSASIGIAFYPDHGEDINELIKLADEAMYRIKNAGKNGFSFAK